MNTKITKEIVEQVRYYATKYPKLTRAELAKLVSISAASVSNIFGGMYDYILKKLPKLKLHLIILK